jgi:tetratricopeptide (TPR) repeat protein
VLNDPLRAKAFLEPLRDEYVSGSFAYARVEQELAETYLAQGHDAAAQPLLQEALTVFQQVGHQQRIAQCHNRLGSIAAARQEPSAAAMHYARALDAWQRTENEIRVTQMGHRLDALKAEGELTETAAIAATEARVGVATQTYATRYIHPFSLYYQRTSIILFALLIGLLSLINVQLRPTIDLISKLTLDASQLERMTYTLDQSVRLAAKVDIEPSPWVIFLVSALTFLLFIFIYAGGGAYLLRRIPLRSLQENFTERVEIDASGIRQISKQASVAIAWDAVHQPVYSTRSFCKNPIDLFSTIALPAAQARIEIDGLVQGYENVEQAIRARFAGSPAGEKDLSVNFLCRGWGLVFLASMALQVLFLIAALIGEEWLRNTLLVLHYTYADLWNIIEVGIALPLLYWLIIQPARYRLYARGQRWNLGMLLGVAFVAFLISLSTIQMGRPAILAGVITLFTGAFVLYDHLRFERDMAEWAPPTDRRRRSLNILLIAGTLALMVAALLSLVTELRSFHHQAVGYEQFLQTQQTVEEAGPALRSEITAAQRRVVQERIALNEMLNQPEAWIAERSQDPKISEVDARELLPVERSNTEMRLAQAETELEQRQLALDEVMAGFQSTKEAFERSIEIKRDAVPYRFLIITHAYLREHKEARAAYEEMQERGLVRPSADSELLTQVLHQGGLDISAPEDKRETWRDALKFYDERLDDPTLSATERAELEHLRAALLVSLAGVSPTERETLLNEAEAIFAARVTQLARRHAGNAPASDLANAYAELGTAYLLRGLDSPGADDERSAIFVSAQSAFEQSIKADPAVLAAYNGLAWSLFEQSRLAPGNCIAGFERPGEAPGYIALIEHAVDAFDDALENPAAETLAEGADERWIKTSASYYRTRAQLHYILAQCDDDAAGYDRGEYLRLAIADYLQATALDERAGWIDRLGDIRVEYARLLKESERPAAATLQHQLAARDYANVIALDQGYFGTRKKLFELLRDDLQVDSPSVQAISLIASAAQRSDDPAFFLAFAQEEIARERGVTALAAAAISRTLALDPANREAIMLAGPLYEQWARPAQTEAERATRYQRAFDAVEQALEIAPDDANLWLTRGRVNLGLGNTEAAIADFKQAQALAPQDPAVMYALGLAHLLNGAVDRANDLYEQANTQAVTQPPPNVKSTYAQAISDLLITSGRDLQSRAALAITIAETSLAQRNVAADDGEALVEMARAASSDGDYEAAIPIWTKAIQLTPEENRNWQSMRSALILSPNFSQIQSGEAVLTLLMGLFDGSENEVLHEVAQIDLDEGVYGLAAAAMERAIALDARDEGAYARLAETYYRWGERWDLDNRLEEAVDVVNRAQAAGIEQAEVYHYASLALRSLRRFDEAIAAGQAAIDLDPTYRTAFSRLGWTAYLAGEYDLSTAVTKQAIDLDPSDPREHFNLGIARAASGDVGGAKAAYEAGLAAADLPENAARRTARLNEALGDLRAIEADPAGLADDLISRLEAALDSSE